MLHQLPRSHRAKRPPVAKPKKETKAEREKRLKTQHDAVLKLRERLAQDDDAVLTYAEWCALNGLSPRQGRRIIALGNGPTITQLSDRRIGVTRRANREWLASRTR